MTQTHIHHDKALAAFKQRIHLAELVIFDFDGVVADSEVLSLETLRTALARFEIYLSVNRTREMFLGTSLRTISAYVKSHGTGAIDTFEKTWEADLFTRFKADLSPVPLVVELLDVLDDLGRTYCIASSGTHERIGIALKAMGLLDRFSHIFSAEQVAQGKPAPDLFNFAAESLQVDPSACLVIEDSPFGVRAANAAGMTCFGFTGGQHMKGRQAQYTELLSSVGADMVLSSFEGVSELRSKT